MVTKINKDTKPENVRSGLRDSLSRLGTESTSSSLGSGNYITISRASVFCSKNREFVIHFGYFFISFLRFIQNWRIIETQLICLFPYYDEAELINTSSLIRFLWNSNFSFKHPMNHAKLFQNFTKQLTLSRSQRYCFVVNPTKAVLVDNKTKYVDWKGEFFEKEDETKAFWGLN